MTLRARVCPKVLTHWPWGQRTGLESLKSSSCICQTRRRDDCYYRFSWWQSSTKITKSYSRKTVAEHWRETTLSAGTAGIPRVCKSSPVIYATSGIEVRRKVLNLCHVAHIGEWWHLLAPGWRVLVVTPYFTPEHLHVWRPFIQIVFALLSLVSDVVLMLLPLIHYWLWCWQNTCRCGRSGVFIPHSTCCTPPTWVVFCTQCLTRTVCFLLSLKARFVCNDHDHDPCVTISSVIIHTVRVYPPPPTVGSWQISAHLVVRRHTRQWIKSNVLWV